MLDISTVIKSFVSKFRNSVEQNALIIGSLFTLSRLIGTLRESIISRYFSRDVYDMYTLAVKIPSMIRRLSSEGTLENAYVPSLTQFKSDQDSSKWIASVSAVIFLFSLLVVSLFLVTLKFWSPVLLSKYAPENIKVFNILFQIMLPIILMYFLSSTFISVLHRYECFLHANIGPALGNIWMVIAIYFGYTLCPSYLMLGMLTLAGASGHIIWQYYGVCKINNPKRIWEITLGFIFSNIGLILVLTVMLIWFGCPEFSKAAIMWPSKVINSIFPLSYYQSTFSSLIFGPQRYASAMRIVGEIAIWMGVYTLFDRRFRNYRRILIPLGLALHNLGHLVADKELVNMVDEAMQLPIKLRDKHITYADLAARLNLTPEELQLAMPSVKIRFDKPLTLNDLEGEFLSVIKSKVEELIKIKDQGLMANNELVELKRISEDIDLLQKVSSNTSIRATLFIFGKFIIPLVLCAMCVILVIAPYWSLGIMYFIIAAQEAVKLIQGIVDSTLIPFAIGGQDMYGYIYTITAKYLAVTIFPVLAIAGPVLLWLGYNRMRPRLGDLQYGSLDFGSEPKFEIPIRSGRLSKRIQAFLEKVRAYDFIHVITNYAPILIVFMYSFSNNYLAGSKGWVIWVLTLCMSAYIARQILHPDYKTTLPAWVKQICGTTVCAGFGAKLVLDFLAIRRTESLHHFVQPLELINYYFPVIVALVLLVCKLIHTYNYQAQLGQENEEFARVNKKFLNIAGNAFFGTGIHQIMSFVSITFSAVLGEGAPSYMNRANKILQFPIGILGVSFGVALLPRVSQLIAEGDFLQAKRIYKRIFRVNIALSACVIIVSLVLAEPIINWFFLGGKTSAQDAQIITNIFRLELIGLPASIILKTLYPIYFSIGKSQLVTTGAVVQCISDLILKLVFFRVGLGIYGISLSWILGSWISVIYLLFNLNITQRTLNVKEIKTDQADPE